MSWHWLGVKPSHARPRVSDDSACAESLFRTAKYRPEFSDKGFADLDAARTWTAGSVHWYNIDHRLSGIRYVAPAQRHGGDDDVILAARHALHQGTRTQTFTMVEPHLQRAPTGAVILKPERDSVVTTHVNADMQPLAA